MRKTIALILSLGLALTASAQYQPDYLPEQLGRDVHHVIQSLGAFVGNERAESQEFDITYMPSGNDVDGVMVINTADYRCTYKFSDVNYMCYELRIDIRSQEFLSDFYNLFSTYRTEDKGEFRVMNFGDKLIIVTEEESRTTRYRSFKLTL